MDETTSPETEVIDSNLYSPDAKESAATQDNELDEPVEEIEVELDPEDPDAEPEEEPPEEVEDVEFEGKQYKLPKELKEALLRQADYTRKTQEVAEDRKTVAAERQAVQQQVKVYQENFAEFVEASNLDNQLKELAKIDRQALIDADPQQAMKLDFHVRELQQRLDHLGQSITTKQQQRTLQEQQETAKRVQEGLAVLERDIKGWSPEVAKQLGAYGQESGFTAEEMAQVIDPRYLKVLHKAHQFDQLQKRQAAKPKPEPQEKPVTRISASKGTAVKDPSQMTQSEFDKWRTAHIKKRSA